jgi:hypothetical protein
MKSSRSKNKSLTGSIKCLGKQSESEEIQLENSLDFLHNEVIKKIKIDLETSKNKTIKL